jgi:rhomboid protease GluP
LNLEPFNIDRRGDPAPAAAVVFRGPKELCHEFSLVLEAQAIEHEMSESGGSWVLSVSPALLHRAYEEMSRYSAERSVPRELPRHVEPFAGAALGAMAYTLVLLIAAYCAGAGVFGVDWLTVGSLDAGAASEWWRAVTALTLHLDQEHLLGNLLFGVVAGVAAGRLL